MAAPICSHGKKDSPFSPDVLLKEKTERIPMWEPREHRPPELRLLCCGYSCTIYEKGCKGDYSANRMTEETAYEGQPRFDTENKIDQDFTTIHNCWRLIINKEIAFWSPNLSAYHQIL